MRACVADSPPYQITNHRNGTLCSPLSDRESSIVPQIRFSFPQNNRHRRASRRGDSYLISSAKPTHQLIRMRGNRACVGPYLRRRLRGCDAKRAATAWAARRARGDGRGGAPAVTGGQAGRAACVVRGAGRMCRKACAGVCRRVPYRSQDTNRRQRCGRVHGAPAKAAVAL